MTRCDVLVVGSANLDLVARAPRLPGPGETVLGTDYAEHPGGKGLNQAVAAARAGARVAFVGAVGDDAAGHRLRTVADADGVDVDDLRTEPGIPTGRAIITVDDAAENSIVVVPAANLRVGAPATVDAAVVLAQLEIPVETVITTMTTARASRAHTVLNPAPATSLPPSLLAALDVIVPNEHEITRLGGVDHLLAAGVGAVVITLGADGVEVVTPAGRRHHPAMPVVPVDTTGAGDAFCGAMAATLARTGDLDAAVERGIVAGALATTAHGAVPSLPRSADIDRALAAHRVSRDAG